MPKAKPDDRRNNARRIQENIDHTYENLREAEEYLAEHADEISPDQERMIREKNKRRKKSIEGMIEEKKDEQNL